jgi:hypothetical protein
MRMIFRKDMWLGSEKADRVSLPLLRRFGVFPRGRAVDPSGERGRSWKSGR